jgi:5'-nucleotidase
VHIVVVGTTDVHGYFNGREFPAKNGIPAIRYGGLPLFKSYVDALRAANDNRVVLVDSGDLFQGTLESNLFEGEPVTRAYNEIGYAAAAVGNHEFDYGPVGPASVPVNPGDDPLGALKQNAQLARWPFLSANMVDAKTGQTPSWAKRSTIVDVAGVKLGIIGLSTPNTPAVTTLANVATLRFLDPVPRTVAEAKKLRAAGADAVIVIAHMGGKCKETGDVNDVSRCEQQQEAMEFLEKLPKATIDAYFGGHTHDNIRNIVNGVPAFEAMSYSRLFATLDLWVDHGAHRVVRTEMRPHTMLCTVVFTGTATCDPMDAPKGETTLVPRIFEGKRMEPDAPVAALLQPYVAKVEAKRAEPTGITTGGPFTRSFTGESTIGDLLADALRDATHADIAVMNSGGIRANLGAGDLTYGDIYEVSPFDNYPSVVTLTGAQVIQMLRLTTTGEFGVFQISGLRYTYDAKLGADLPMRQRDRLVSVVLPNGFPISPDASYRVAMPDFVADGGDGLLPIISKLPPGRVVTDRTRTLRDLILETLKTRRMPLVPKKDGRITVLNAPASNEAPSS